MEQVLDEHSFCLALDYGILIKETNAQNRVYNTKQIVDLAKKTEQAEGTFRQKGAATDSSSPLAKLSAEVAKVSKELNQALIGQSIKNAVFNTIPKSTW